MHLSFTSMLALLCIGLSCMLYCTSGYSCACDNECAPSVISNKLSLFFKGVTSIRNDGSDADNDQIELGQRIGVSLEGFQEFLTTIADDNIVYYAGAGSFSGFDEFTDKDSGYAAAIYPSRRGSIFMFDSISVDISTNEDGNEEGEVDYWIYRRTPGTDETTVNLQHGKQTWRKYYSSDSSGSGRSSSKSSSRSSSSDSSEDDVSCEWKLLLAGYEGRHLFSVALGSFDHDE